MKVSHPVFLSVLLAIATVGPNAGAAEAYGVKSIKLDIASQPLGDALNEFAKQAKVQLVLYSRIGEGLLSPRIAGTLSPQAALEQLLQNTGLKYEYLDADTVRIFSPPAKDHAAAVGQEPGAASVHLAQASKSNGAVPAEPSSVASTEPAFAGIPELLVRGSRTLNMDIKRSQDEARPYVVFDRETIQRSGAGSIDELLFQKLPMSATSQLATQPGIFQGNATKIDLRGLGTDQTLILVDGHRTASYNLSGAPNQPDLNGIPLAAVERIEVLPITASGIYGGSATGGVVNVVLRRDYDRMETALNYGNTFRSDAANRRVDMSAGFNIENGRTNVLLAGSYADSDPLLVGERDFFRRFRADISANVPGVILDGFTPPLGTTTNICTGSFDTCNRAFGIDVPLTLKNGTLLGNSITFLPAGYAGTAADNGAQLIANAGQYNLGLANTVQQSAGSQAALLSDTSVKSLIGTVRREFKPGLSAFLEFAGSDNRSHFFGNAVSSTFSIPSSAPGNPFAQDVVVTTPALGVGGAINSRLRNQRVLGGVLFALPKSWQGEVDYTWSRARSFFSQPPSLFTGTFNGLTVDQALQSGALNVFRDTNAFPVDFSPYLNSTTVYPDSNSTQRNATLRAGGPLASLPSGVIALSALLEQRKDVLGEVTVVFPSFVNYVPSRSQTVESLYLESTIPLVSASTAVPGVRLLELQLSARHDRYETVGSNASSSLNPVSIVRATNHFDSTDPSVALRYQPVQDVTVRATYGTGFLPPAVTQLVPNVTRFSAATMASFASFFTDPLRGNETVGGGAGIDYVSGGSPGLGPEKSRSWSAGVIVTPRFAPGLRVSVDWMRTRKTDNIEAPFTFTGATSFFNFEQLIPGLISRGPPSGGFAVGPVTALNSTLRNIARQQVEAYDISVEHRHETARFGAFTFSTAATRQMHSQQQILPTSPVTEIAGDVSMGGSLRWRGNSSLTWDYRQWAATWTASYFDSYSYVSTTIPSQIYHDVVVRYSVEPQKLSKWFTHMQVQLGVQNIFDKAPPLSPPSSAVSGNFAYSFFGDPRLARYSLTLKTQF